MTTHYICCMLDRWLGVRVDSISAFIIFFTSLFTVMSRGNITAGLAGLAIVYSFKITRTLYWWITLMCALENESVALERILEYTNNSKEAEWVCKDEDESLPE